MLQVSVPEVVKRNLVNCDDACHVEIIEYCPGIKIGRFLAQWDYSVISAGRKSRSLPIKRALYGKVN
jgi:hypothetical protein